MCQLKQIECNNCGNKFPVFADLIEGTISTDCKKCGRRNVITADKPKEKLQQATQHI